MRKLLLFTSLLVGLLAQAASVSQPQAMEIAQKFLNPNSPRRIVSHSGLASQLSLAHTAVDKAGNVDIYVFNRADDAGYILVSGDDTTIPILGYGDGAFNPENVPDGLKYWLDECQRQIEYLKEHPEQARKAQSVASSVKPLLTCNWNQSAPYNNNCPTYGSSNRAVTGCVATATAQIMYYHKWPEQGTGSHSYSCNVNGSSTATTLSANFANSRYDWGNMIDNYDSNSTSAQNAAVAKLMSDVGISVDMSYGASSGAYSPNVVAALTTYFKYDKSATYLSRASYGVDEWESIIRSELAANRPVYYSGHASTGGHAFVCDGYNTDGYFHFNWGWGGMSNGYFILSMLNPREQGIGSFEGGYNSSQGIIINIKPDEGGQPLVVPTRGSINLATTTSSCSLGAGANFSMKSVCVTTNETWNTHYWGFAVTDPTLDATIDDAYDVQWTVNASSTTAGNSYSVSSTTFTPSTSLKEGKYYVRACYYIDGKSGLFGGQSASNYVVDMEVKDSKAYFSQHKVPSDLTATDFVLSSNTLYKDQAYQAQVKVVNNDVDDYNGNLYYALMQNGTAVYTSDAFLMGIAGKGSRTINATLTASVSTGNYYFAVLNSAKKVIGQTPVTVADGGGTINLSVVTNVTPAASQMPAKEIKATAVIKNTGGTFSGQIQCWIVNSTNNILATLYSNTVTVEKNQTVTVNFQGEFAGNVGTTYNLCLRNPNPAYASRNQAWSSFVPFTVCAPPVEPEYPVGDVNGDGVVDVLDVNAVLLVIMNSGEEAFRNRADVNGDGAIDILDLNSIVAIII